jgi:hypothetical protein
MKTLASMYKIGGWKLPSLQKCSLHTVYPHTLILKQRRTFFRTTIHITHPMHLAIGYYCLYYILLMLMGIDVVMFQLQTNQNLHKFTQSL